MTVGGTRRVSRWPSAIAIVAALGLFGAVTAGWASCGTAVAGVGLPQAAAQHQQTVQAGANAAPARADRVNPVAPRFSSGSTPAHHKTTKNAWMTRDRPPTWERSSPPSIGSPLPDSFAAAAFRLPDAPFRDPGAVPPDRDLLTRLCIARC
ncbi:hypothetical protein A5692_10510 [Mycobacterium sp. E342]|uniref:hypothetical protein n=1 Tax=Mycobacterium sp. E342 TaxID=1834147 RepID=UPI0008024529|nr:hypothetical protein [Mycobacterium sp. E342]OBH36198.1 hypothetical protein A5692_10510 [Mycobacterium sp. E342]